jgi:formamidopyrimidine-DNA glycosylase
MPELPEVEISRLGIIPHIQGQKVTNVVVRHRQLRWPVAENLEAKLMGEVVCSVTRRGKYLLIGVGSGTLIIHLGMSGSLRILAKDHPVEKHDHVDIVFANGKCLRLTDPRRFGAVLWTNEDPRLHPLLKKLGPEPLEKSFNGNYLYQLSQDRKTGVKQFIMNSHVVVGVGNIYANEALFDAKINPRLAAGNISRERYHQLAKSIKKVLRSAIKQGGTTLRNFLNSEGKPGYFMQHLQVYGRGGELCFHCKTQLKEIRMGQRTTVFCPKCQKSRAGT